MIEWNDSYSVGIKLIDAQHKKLFAIFKELDSVIEKASPEEIEDLIFKLKAYVMFHFSEEEKYFEKFQFEKSIEHKKQHREYSEKITEFHESFNKDSDITKELYVFIQNWIMNHINITDKEYSQCFQEHGLE